MVDANSEAIRSLSTKDAQKSCAHSISASAKHLSRLATGRNFGQQISLRPEATASVVRAYIEHGMQTLPGNVKLYYMGPMFRRERPQKGRYRQFYQIGAEVLGPSDAPGIDAEVIEMLLAFFERVTAQGRGPQHQFHWLQAMPSCVCRKIARRTAKGARTTGRGQPAPHRDESVARAGLET